MANTIKVKRGTDANRAGVTPAEGELLYTTDTKKVYVGDGSTAGGNEVGGGGSQTPAELLADIKTVDGSGSGLDADLLDGQQGSYYAAASSLSSYLPLSGGTLTGRITVAEDTDALRVRSDSNGAGANISFSDHAAGSYLQNGSIRYVHSDGSSYGSGNAFIVESTEPTMTFLADGKLMFKEGIYSKPATGTGAGTRKDLNWDTAYGWGNHASAGYFLASNYTNVFKSGSEIAGSQDLNNYRTTGYYSQDSNADATSGSNYPVSLAGILEVVNGDQGNGLQTEQRYSRYNNNDKYVRHYYNGTWTSWHKLWHSGNDGSGSGLDADLLDGVQGSQFLRSDEFDQGVGLRLTGGSYSSTYDTVTTPLVINQGQYTYFDSGTGYLRRIIGTSGTTIEIGQSGTGIIQQINLLPGNAGNSAVKVNGNTVWNAGNDGSGSGLDADTVDGIQASQFLRSDAADTKTSGTLTFNDNVIAAFGSSNDAEFFCNGSHFYLDLNSGIGNFYIRDGTTTRFTFDDAGSFTATGNITAYSDRRLKDDIQQIEGAVQKVQQLSGNTYTRNDLPDTQRRYAGVIAQEVEAVLPEAVSEAEDGTKTVDYNATIALLIEAVKELKAEVDELKGAK